MLSRSYHIVPLDVEDREELFAAIDAHLARYLTRWRSKRAD